MRLSLFFTTLVCALICSAAANATSGFEAAGARDSALSIRVEGDGWGEVSNEAIQTVLYSVAEVLMPQVPKRLVTPIVVSHTDSNPVALYERGPNGEILVRLHASAAKWHLYVYEFAHELCHVMSNYQRNVAAGTSKHNQWLEETLCETASLFTLKQLAASWSVSPPSAAWSPRAEKLQRFFDLLIGEQHRQLPADLPLASWLRENEEQLRHNPYQREKNDLMANLLLPMFVQHPGQWDSLCYLNLDPTDASSSLERYLLHWYKNAPAEHRPFVADILGLLRAQDAAVVVNKAAAGLATGALRDGSAGPAKDTEF
jgi:hypothetical protein